MTTIQRVYFRTSLALLGASSFVSNVIAQGIPPEEGIPLPNPPLKEAIISVLKLVLNFLALIAVIAIVIAGIRLIMSQGSDDQKDKAKKTILYVVVGLVVVLFARVIVEFFTQTLPAAV